VLNSNASWQLILIHDLEFPIALSKLKKQQQNIGTYLYNVFQGFSKAKSANGGSILRSSQFLILPQLPQKIKLASKMVKVDSKIIISLPKI
jgi:hypothetical protein